MLSRCVVYKTSGCQQQYSNLCLLFGTLWFSTGIFWSDYIQPSIISPFETCQFIQTYNRQIACMSPMKCAKQDQEVVPHFIHILDSGLIRRISPFLFILQLHKGWDVITHPCTKTWSKGVDESLHETQEGMVEITCPCHYITPSIQCVPGMCEVKYQKFGNGWVIKSSTLKWM